MLIGRSLPDVVKRKFPSLLEEYLDVFAWSTKDLGGIPKEIVMHKLNVDLEVKPVRQKKRSFTPEQNKTINEEVDMFLEANPKGSLLPDQIVLPDHGEEAR